ncbi:protease SohB [Candidatus Pantoea carbekii]|uniref:SohB protein n=1 Tax=Candidatus Pantoea carbekii TaxID=1235990 RepID=U3U6L2_9GAMM|nr:protease SohB [Candidatus Pantoea carbekii]AKC32069.1 protease SohB [Candidatus Pantoea carbekii]BAO00595.1 SohB protein [Candidatus Pantoea carbekii]
MDVISNYGLFLAKSITTIFTIAIILMLINNTLRKRQNVGQLRLTNLNEKYHQIKKDIELAKMKPWMQKIYLKQNKKAEKQKIKTEKSDTKRSIEKKDNPILYVIEFKGSIKANEISSLRKEISAILMTANIGDEVLLRLESRGGLINAYGLAASQLQRLRDSGLYLTVAVDKIAASGGYMMACVANRIVAAPFAIIGSIGVVAQIPNFNRLLKRKDIDVELHTAGQYKRTLTLFGENTDTDREKFCENLNETHQLFKTFVHQMRPSLDLEKVATGEHWYGRQALNLGLIDDVSTSDSLLIEKMNNFTVLRVNYVQKHKMINCVMNTVSQIVEQSILKIWYFKDKTIL